ncbi:calpain-8-like [Bufo gargarizans]|uniref:calpain-8-like n=1 Tax=Bufo gargarizans TaxID=30331 RepID=UPI001CF4DF47|nr:calpain-8-like [Bufo gargarizans]
MASLAAKLAKDRATASGVGANKNPRKYLNQDLEELRAQCLASKTLFEDPTFPAVQSSLGFKDLDPKSQKVQDIVWKRPLEIKPNPQFINEGATRADVWQGSLGDCWFLSSVASLTLNEDCLRRVVPMDQSFDTNYAGIFHFKFWQYGEWVDVVVDDRLPTKKNNLLFVKSTAANEFWSALLEKAYAKLNGSYQALIGGLPLEALQDFTGGIGELYSFDNAPQNLFQIIQKALRRKSLVTCSTKSDSGTETVVSTNIVKNHTYSLTGAEEVFYRGGTVQIVRVRNPWGFKEWNGAWSDKAPQWDEIDSKVKANWKIECDDGEAWMPFSSFVVEFYRVEICHLTLDNICCNENHKWCLTEFSGSWTPGFSAGGWKGSPNFWTNPQFRITLAEPDMDDTGVTDKSLCTVIVSLMQKDRRRKEPEAGGFHCIAYYIYKIPSKAPSNVQMGKDFFKKNKDVARADIFKNHREVSKRFQLPVGNYMIVPATYYPSEEADFFLRIFTKTRAEPLEIGNMVGAKVYEHLVSSSPATEDQNRAEKKHEEKAEFKAEDLKSILNKLLSKRDEFKSDGFSLKTCKEIINLLDVDITGTLSNEEVSILQKKLKHYMKIFLEADTNFSGSIDAHEMRNALQKAGFSLNNRIQEVIVQRYVSAELSIKFEDFIACMIRLETLFKMFHILDTDKDGMINLSLSEWICTGLI